MKKTEKVNYINNLKKDLEANNALMVYHYIGLNVKQLDELRNKMREAGALVKVKFCVLLSKAGLSVDMKKLPILCASSHAVFVLL